MKRFLNIKRNGLWLLLFALLYTSCKVDKILPVAESKKDISGSWKVVKATRNGTDLMSVVDFSQFRVKFDANGGYTLVNPLPFVVAKDGKFTLDDPNYPYLLTFTPTGTSGVSTNFNYPIVSGVRQLNLSFSPGCTLNTYIYTLVKE